MICQFGYRKLLRNLLAGIASLRNFFRYYVGKEMKLTESKAVEISIELWEWLAETGSRQKRSWPGWNQYKKYAEPSDYNPYGTFAQGCCLCEYDKQQLGRCEKCPYWRRYGFCNEFGSPYRNWSNWNNTSEERKLYAAEFLAQLKELKHE
jgi:hypothetical protein